MHDEELWTIIIRTRGNKSSELSQAVRSVVSQKYQSKSLIVAIHTKDPALVQETRTVLKTFQNKIPLSILLADPSKKRGHPLNIALDHCQGRYVSFLDDDDKLLPGAGSFLISKLQKDNLNFAYGKAEINHQPDTKEKIETYSHSFNPIRLVAENYIPIGSFIYDFSEFADIRTDETIDMWEDWYLLLSMLFSGKMRARFFDHSVLEIRTNGQRASNTLNELNLSKIRTDYNVIEKAFIRKTFPISYEDSFLIYPKLAVLQEKPNTSEIQLLRSALLYHKEITDRYAVRLYLKLVHLLKRAPPEPLFPQ